MFANNNFVTQSIHLLPQVRRYFVLSRSHIFICSLLVCELTTHLRQNLNALSHKRVIRYFVFLLFGLSSFFSVAHANCSVNTSVLSFVAYDFIAIGSNDSSTQLRIQCDPDIPYAVKMNAGLNSAGDYSQRQMQSAQGSTPLLYNIYLDASYSQIWGDGRGFSSFYSGLSSGSPVVLPIYGRIPSKQPVAPGVYTDAVVITIEW